MAAAAGASISSASIPSPSPPSPTYRVTETLPRTSAAASSRAHSAFPDHQQQQAPAEPARPHLHRPPRPQVCPSHRYLCPIGGHQISRSSSRSMAAEAAQRKTQGTVPTAGSSPLGLLPPLFPSRSHTARAQKRGSWRRRGWIGVRTRRALLSVAGRSVGGVEARHLDKQDIRPGRCPG